MTTFPPDLHPLDATQQVSASELQAMCGLEIHEITELIEWGALQPAGDEAAGSRVEATFSATCVMPLREAARMKRVFDLDLFTVGLLLGYLRRIEALEGELESLHAQWPAHLGPLRHRPTGE